MLRLVLGQHVRSTIRRYSMGPKDPKREIVRPHWYVSQFDNRGRIEKATPQDLDMITDFISKGFATCEPVTNGLQLNVELSRDYFRKHIEVALKSDFTLLGYYLGKLVGTFVVREVRVDHLHSTAIEAEIMSDYKEEIDAVMASGCSDRRLARMEVFMGKFLRVLPNLVPRTVEKLVYIEYGYVLPEYRGAFLGKLLLQDVRRLALNKGYTHFMTVITNQRSARPYKTVISIIHEYARLQICDVLFVFPYSKFLDGGEQVFAQPLLHDTELAFLALGETDDPTQSGGLD